MRKKGLICYLLSILLCFSSCFIADDDSPTEEDLQKAQKILDVSNFFVGKIMKISHDLLGWKTDEELVEETFNNLTAAIINRDSETLKGLFSKKSVEEDSDFDENMEELFKIFQDGIISYDDWGGPGMDGHKENGRYIEKRFISTYDITTTRGEYRIAIEEISIDEDSPDNVGIRSFYIIKAEDTDREFAYWGGYEWNPGITIEYSKSD